MGKFHSHKRFRRFLFGVVGIFIFVLALSQFGIVSTLLRDFIEDKLNETLEQEVSIVQLRLRPLRLGIDFEGVSITDKTGTVTIVPEASVRLQVPIGRPLIRSIILEHPNIHLQITPSIEKKEFSLPEEFPFSNLQVNDAKLMLVGDGFSYQGRGLSLLYHEGELSLWAEDKARLDIGDRTIDLEAFHWDDIQVNSEEISFEGLFLETSMMNIIGGMKIKEDAISGQIELYSRLSNFIENDEFSIDGAVELILKPRGTISELGFNIQAEILDVSLESQLSTRTANYSISKIEIDAEWKNEELEIIAMELPWAGGIVRATGLVQPSTTNLELNLSSEGTDFYHLFRDLDMSDAPWVGMDFTTSMQLKGSYDPFSLRGPLHLEGSDFLTAGGDVRTKTALLNVPVVELEGSVYVDSSSVIYDLPSFSLEETSGSILAEFSFKAPNETNIKFDFPHFVFSEMAPLGGSRFQGKGYLKGEIKGPRNKMSFQSYGKVRDFSLAGIPYADELEFSAVGASLKEIDLSITKARKNESEMFGEMHISFRPEIILHGKFETEGGSANDFMSIFFTPLDIDAEAIGEVRLNGAASNLNVEADFELKDASLWGEPFDFGEFHLRMNKDLMTIEEISLQRNDGIGSVLMRGTRKDGLNNFEILAGAIPIEYLSLLVEKNSPIRGKIDLFAKIQGESYIPSGRIQVRDIWYGLQPIGEGTILFFEQDDHMEYQLTMEDTLKVHGRSGYSLDDDFLFHYQSQDFPIHVVSQRSFNGDWLTGKLSSVGYVQQLNQKLSGYSSVADLNVQWKERTLFSPEVWTVDWAEDEIEFSPLHIVGSGKTNFVFQGKRAQKKNDFQAVGQVDLRILEMIMPYTNRANGAADFTASLGQNGLMADVEISQGFLDGTWFPHSIEDISSSVHISADSYQIDSFQARIGGGEVNVSGAIESRELIPEIFDLEMNFDNSRIQLIDWLPPVVGDGQLKVTGPFEYPMISGDVRVQEMNFTDRIDWEDTVITFAPSALSGSSEDNQPGYFQYDINMSAADTIRIRNNLADMYASADLKFIGDIAKPGMLGTVQLSENGRALFKERDFEITRGELRYEDPFSFDPILDIAMKTTVDTSAQDYEIDYYVTDYYSNWQIHTSSNPALPQADINALLLFGMTREELDIQGGLGSALAIEGSDLLVSKFGVVQRFGEVGEGIFQSEFLKLDRIDIISGATDRNSAYVSSALRLLAEKDIGDGTIRLEQNLTETSDIFVSWEQQIAKRLYTRLYWSSQQQGRYLNTNGAFGAEFELKWELD